MYRHAERMCALAATAALISGCAAAHSGRSQRAALGAEGGDASVAALRGQGWSTDFTRHLVDLSEFQNGGPPRDGIPPIDHPRFVSEPEGDRYVSAREPVIALVVAGEARAYPIQILVWHEIVNDEVAGEPISVTYCPLCNSAIVYSRRVGGRILSFGTTGMLRNSDLVMWDRQTQSWWQQFEGRALVGALAGERLVAIDSQVLSWQQFKASYPQGVVLSRETGFQRPYGTNPYVGYEPGQTPLLYSGRPDPRLPPLERVVAVFSGGAAAVVPFARLEREPVVSGRVAGQPFVVLFSPHVLSALDARRISSSKEVGTAGVFDPDIAGRTLRFGSVPSGFLDDQTRSIWDVTGRALSGPLRGSQLAPRRHDEQFWFALAAFIPHAALLR